SNSARLIPALFGNRLLCSPPIYYTSGMIDIGTMTFDDVDFDGHLLMELARRHLLSTERHYALCVNLQAHKHLLSECDVLLIETEVETTIRLRRRLVFLCENLAKTVYDTSLSTLTKAARLLHLKEQVADLQDHHSLLRLNKVRSVTRRLESSLRLRRERL
ncbi:hypothetical protein PMAYCL1PPCAC_30599, partial [Pristionchus mayeri]